MKTNNRILELDALRGLAALSVVLYHYTTRYFKLFDPKFENYFEFNYGNMGVELFFILSGYVIFMSLNRTKNPIEFLYKRFLRLYPVYWICMIITFICVKSVGLEGREVSFSDFLVNFSMLQFGILIPSVDGVYWSLFHELMFYCLMALLINLIKGRHLNYFIICWLLLSIINHFYQIKVISVLLNLVYAPLFAAGICFYKLSINQNSKSNILMITFCFLSYMLVSEAHLDRWLYEVVIIFGFFIIFYLNSIGKIKFLAVKPLIFLGKISYALYLIHQNIGYIILNYVYEHVMHNQILILVPISFSIILASIITIYLEKPLVYFIKQKTIFFKSRLKLQ